MIKIFILEPNDLIYPEDWCRPLYISSGYGDSISTKSCYSGTPENNLKWVLVKHVLGPCWFFRPISEYFRNNEVSMEFARGDIPKEHQLNMSGYTILSDLNLSIGDEDD